MCSTFLTPSRSHSSKSSAKFPGLIPLGEAAHRILEESEKFEASIMPFPSSSVQTKKRVTSLREGDEEKNGSDEERSKLPCVCFPNDFRAHLFAFDGLATRSPPHAEARETKR